MVRASARSEPRAATKGVALRVPEALLEDLRLEATIAHRSLHSQILWILSRRHLIANAERFEHLIPWAGAFPDLEDVRGDLRTLERDRADFLERLRDEPA